MSSRCLIAALAIVTEGAAWAVQFNAGARFILTATDPIAVVRSTVALMFIQVCRCKSLAPSCALMLALDRTRSNARDKFSGIRWHGQGIDEGIYKSCSTPRLRRQVETQRLGKLVCAVPPLCIVRFSGGYKHQY